MTGASSRRRGNRYEVELTHYLSANLDCEVITSRNGRGGTQGGSDLQWWDEDRHQWVHGVKNWSIEAKDVKNRAVPTWLRQARDDAYGPWWCVMHRTRGTTDRNLDSVYLPRRMLLDYLLYGQPTVDTYDVADYLELTAGQWCEVAS